MEIRSILPEELPAAIELIWDTFQAYEAPEYPAEGIATFRDSLDSPDYLGALELWGAFREEKLLGVIATRSQRGHIALFFVKQSCLGQGIGRQLFAYLLPLCPGPLLTVNSSPYAVAFYEKLGFVADSPEQLRDGIRFTPMHYQI